MYLEVSYLPLALLFLASALPSNAQTTEASATTLSAPAPVAADPATSNLDGDIIYFDRNFTLKCDLAPEGGNNIVWKKNGTSLEEVHDLKGRYTLVNDNTVFKTEGRVHEDDFGNYSCSVGAKTTVFKVYGKRQAKLQANTNAVEGQPLKLHCKIIGKPYPSAVSWRFYNTSEENATGYDVIQALGSDRVMLKENDQNITNAELVVEKSLRSDAGKYKCIAEKTTVATSTVRVKDVYAALWPFLGICAEVFILCAIILVYEKRRTKPEMDDSDTDNHDQKKS